eukprot:Sspe_Gene.75348::Locus_47082_Transcript_1_1_Confidence_1.000_Length_1432::g.75348::m.75348/K00002/AKR1A1, adh; alcohol dehydrogenase (NADP+)
MLTTTRKVPTLHRLLGVGSRHSSCAPQPSALPTVVLPGDTRGKPMPMIGLGTFTGTRLTQKVPPGTMKETALKWIKHGGRMLDCAQNYLNEAEIGDAIAEAKGMGVSRDELWISSKLNNPYHKKEHVRPALEKTLLDLGTDYVDLYLMHWPTAFVYVPFEDGDLTRRGLSMDYEPDQCSKVTGVKWADLDAKNWPPPHLNMEVTIHETWAAMVELKEAGLAKNIGVCNTQVQLLHELLCGTKTKPAVVQAESHPYNQQWGLLKYCHLNNIQFQAYSPLGYGEFIGKDETPVLTNPVLQKIAVKHGLPSGPGGVAAVCLAWCTQRGVATMPMTLKDNEMIANLRTGELVLDDEDLQMIRSLDRKYHYLRPESWYGLPYWD